jgi:hypothetical protein
MVDTRIRVGQARILYVFTGWPGRGRDGTSRISLRGRTRLGRPARPSPAAGNCPTRSASTPRVDCRPRRPSRDRIPPPDRVTNALSAAVFVGSTPPIVAIVHSVASTFNNSPHVPRLRSAARDAAPQRLGDLPLRHPGVTARKDSRVAVPSRTLFHFLSNSSPSAQRSSLVPFAWPPRSIIACKCARHTCPCSGGRPE